jgi:hypothetical protein
MFISRRRARFHTPELIALRIESERSLQQLETAALAKRLAAAIEMQGVTCDGQTALRMFADRLESRAQQPG